MIGMALVIMLGYMAITNLGNPMTTSDITFSNNRITITGDETAKFSVPMEEIESCILRDDWSIGHAVKGGTTRKTSYGLWCNDEVGEYMLWVKPQLKRWVVIKTYADEYYVINAESNETTEELHAALHRSFLQLGLTVAGE